MVILIILLVLSFITYFITIFAVDSITTLIWEIGKVVLWEVIAKIHTLKN